MPWEPQPEEADLFCNVYIDESSQTKHRFLVIGGLVVPLSHVRVFEEDIALARSTSIVPIAQPDGTPRVMKWEKVNDYNFNAYKTVIDTVFHFPRLRNLPARKEMGLYCVVVDTSQKPLKTTGEGDVDVGFNKEFYFLCAAQIGKRFKKELFHLYPDHRHTNQPLQKAREIMNYGAYKHGDKRKWPFRRLRFESPKDHQSLQVVDILIGALAYRLNGHANKPGARAAKKNLSDYVLKLFKVDDPFNTTPFYRKRFSLVHRPRPPNSPKSGPQNVR